MKKCKLCKSKMPDELFVSAFIDGGYTQDLCPICTMTLIDKIHGLPFGTEPKGEQAKALVDEAWQYYKPIGNDIYGIRID